jgi:ABC-type nitrate/sulfonate/bicarbonate transport system ATPase subunit
MVFQSPNILPWLTAFQNVLLGADQVFLDKTRAERAEIVEHYLSLVDLADDMHKRPAQLSQGMRQRVGLARAFVLAPKVLLLDEPFGMLDSLTRVDLQEVLIDLCIRDGKTAVMVTHDVDEAVLLSDRVVMMTSGPSATIGEILSIDIERPREHAAFLDNARSRGYREEIISFLEDARRHSSPFAKATEEDRSPEQNGAPPKVTAKTTTGKTVNESPIAEVIGQPSLAALTVS